MPRQQGTNLLNPCTNFLSLIFIVFSLVTQDAGDNKKSESVHLAYANCSQTKALDVSANMKEQLNVLNETIRNLQTQLLENKTKDKENLAKIFTLEQKLKQANVKELLLKTRIMAARKGSCNSVSEHNSQSDASDKDVVCVDDDDDSDDDDDDNHDNNVIVSENAAIDQEDDTEVQISCDTSNQNIVNQQQIAADEARLIALISSFLVIHPFGASLENILLYVNEVTAQFHAKHIENVLHRYKCIFSEIVRQSSNDANTDENASGNGTGSDGQQHKWKFNGFDKNNDEQLKPSTDLKLSR